MKLEGENTLKKRWVAKRDEWE